MEILKANLEKTVSYFENFYTIPNAVKNFSRLFNILVDNCPIDLANYFTKVSNILIHVLQQNPYKYATLMNTLSRMTTTNHTHSDVISFIK